MSDNEEAVALSNAIYKKLLFFYNNPISLRTVPKNIKKIIWLQEEPKNKGAWQYINDTISPMVKNLKFVGRNFSPSPASGSSTVHKLQQQQIFDDIIKE